MEYNSTTGERKIQLDYALSDTHNRSASQLVYKVYDPDLIERTSCDLSDNVTARAPGDHTVFFPLLMDKPGKWTFLVTAKDHSTDGRDGKEFNNKSALEAGDVLSLVAYEIRVEPDGDQKLYITGGKAAITVKATVTDWTGKPAPAGLTVSWRWEDPDEPDDNLAQQRSIPEFPNYFPQTQTDSNGISTQEVTFPLVSGDNYRMWGGVWSDLENKIVEDSTGIFTIWKKLHIEVDWMQNPGSVSSINVDINRGGSQLPSYEGCFKPFVSRVQEAFAQAYVEVDFSEGDGTCQFQDAQGFLCPNDEQHALACSLPGVACPMCQYSSTYFGHKGDENWVHLIGVCYRGRSTSNIWSSPQYGITAEQPSGAKWSFIFVMTIRDKWMVAWVGAHDSSHLNPEYFHAFNADTVVHELGHQYGLDEGGDQKPEGKPPCVPTDDGYDCVMVQSDPANVDGPGTYWDQIRSRRSHFCQTCIKEIRLYKEPL